MKLEQKIKTIDELDKASIERMYELMKLHFDQIEWDKFQYDLSKKEGVLLLYDSENIIQGLSTYCTYHVMVDEKEIHAVFSGDSIVNKEVWGTTAPMQILLKLFRESAKKYPENLYWYLISKGHRTYLLLPLLFNTFFPAWNQPAIGEQKKIIDALSSMKFGELYDDEKMLINEKADRLKAEIALPKRRNKHVDFFLENNPDYRNGVELPCIAAINEENMSAFANRYT